MLASSVLNSVTFWDLSGNYPNRSNRLYNDKKEGGLTVGKYWQKYNNSNTIYLQFESDSATVPILKTFIAYEKESINGTLAATRGTSDIRYYWNFEVEMSADYHDKIVSFTLEQVGSDTLTSEPICVSDISEDIENGDIKLIQYTNFDFNVSTDGQYIDWTVLDKMFFYVESRDVYKPDGSVDILEDVDTKTNIASKLYRGQIFLTGNIPWYLCEKIIAASILDFFTINEIQYNVPEIGDPEPIDGNTLMKMSIDMTETYAVGLNSDDLGSDGSVTPENMIVTKRNDEVTSAGWEVENPEGYMLHSVWIKHDSTSAAAIAVVTLGTTIAGTDIIDAVQGSISKVTYVTKWKIIPRHYLKDPDNASTLYFSVAGAGAKMNIIVNFDTVTTTT